jgi:hypothetical protein
VLRASQRFCGAIAGELSWPVLAAWVLAAGVVLAQEGPQASSDKGLRSKGRVPQTADQAADPNLAARVKDYVSKQLWKSRISALPAERPGADKDGLEQLIGRVKAAEVRARPKDRAFADSAAPSVPAEPNSARVAKAGSPLAQPAAAKPAPVDANGTAVAQPVLPEGMDPNHVTDPFKMAEILFESGLHSKAAPFYQKALAQTDPQDKKKASQRQWILLQLGRCWREDQPAQARQMFSQLISEYPDSPWIDVARTWQGLTDWYLTEQPRQFVQRMTVPLPAQAGANPQPATQPQQER